MNKKIILIFIVVLVAAGFFILFVGDHKAGKPSESYIILHDSNLYIYGLAEDRTVVVKKKEGNELVISLKESYLRGMLTQKLTPDDLPGEYANSQIVAMYLDINTEHLMLRFDYPLNRDTEPSGYIISVALKDQLVEIAGEYQGSDTTYRDEFKDCCG
jgi:hypothetical protein